MPKDPVDPKGVPVDTQYLIEEQGRLRTELTSIFNQQEQTLTRGQKKARIEQVEGLLAEFKSNHSKILTLAKPDIPYIVNKSGQSTIVAVEENLSKLQRLLGTETILPSIPTAAVRQAIADQKVRLKKLHHKLGSLKFSIQEIQGEILDEASIQKEFFDIKQRFLFEQWSSIAALEEEIVISDSEETPLHIPGMCHEVYSLMNACLKTMLSLITPTAPSSQIVTFRDNKLPDLKVPVFKGDYKQWKNFKDIFESLIHSKENLSTVHKMEYLKTYLEGEPLRLISAFTLSAENYKDAYDTLKKRYDHKRKLFTIHLDSMFKPLSKNPSAESMKELHDSLSEGIIAIRNMGIDNESWGPMIVHFAISCLDMESRALYEHRYNEQHEDIPQIKEFLSFLENRYKTLEVMDPLKNNNSNFSKAKINYHEERKINKQEKKTSVGCHKCDGDHKIFMCPRFLALSVKSRYKFVKNIKLCLNCLQKHPNQPCSSKRTCKHCEKTHNSLLHFESTKPSHGSETQESAVNLALNSKKEELLATALVIVRDRFGNPFQIKVLIDTGAQRNYVTEELVQRLRLPRKSCRTDVTGIGAMNAYQVKYEVEFNIEPVFPSNIDIGVDALVMGKKLTSPTPDAVITEKLPENWPELQLADPKFRFPAQIDLILGVAFFAKIISSEIHRSDHSGLIAMNSKLGWLILGESRNIKKSSYKSVKATIAIEEIRDDMSKFWEIEDIPQLRPSCIDDELCESIFVNTHIRQSDGRYTVCIPFKSNPINLGSSKKRALCRFYSLEEKFKKNLSYAESYRQFMSEYIKLGHMTKIRDDALVDDSYFMPHHGVLKPDSTTTKLRVVFDASAKTTQNFSLNDFMLAGPRLQDDLARILLRWRYHQFVISADVEKMYRQIRIAPEHQRYQQVFWRNSTDEPIGVYQLTTVTYGTKSAPYLAVKVLQQLAVDEGDAYPLAVPAVLRDFYVDDVLTGANSMEECKSLQKQLKALLSQGGFALRKWTSNCSQILSSLNPEDINRTMLNIQESSETSLKTLGLIWNPKRDAFSFKVSELNFDNIKTTKRTLSSDMSKIFDPLGWISPVTVAAKILFQETWTSPIDWNDELPKPILSGWKKFRSNLKHLENINIPRWLSTLPSCHIELHGFCDASEYAYAAAVYVKCVSLSGEVVIRLLMAKTKVAPIKQKLTVAKLELCGAHLLSKLYNYVVQSYQWEEKPFNAWCDSNITLAWIAGDVTRWKIFVANRVSDIHKFTNNCCWRYVPTKENPADCATRGLTAEQLLNHKLWWTGPTWLKQDRSYWPTSSDQKEVEVPEVKKTVKSLVIKQPTEDLIEGLISRFSSFGMLKAVIAYCFRFVTNCKTKSRNGGCLTPEELLNAEEAVIRQVQRQHYYDEIKQIKGKQKLHNINGLLSLSPMLDEKGLLRVTGRLQNAAIDFNEKHPIILPRKTHVSKLIVLDAHIRCCHGLHTLTEYVVKRKFWIIRCKDLIKNIIHYCVVCNRKFPKLNHQFMGQLPLARINLVNPFYYTGVDFAGPFSIRPWKGRCTKTYKAYICVFVCMTVKALHLELVSDLTSEGFLAAYRRFSSRRGPCLHIHSDCGTNFVGANKLMEGDLAQYQREWDRQIRSLTVQGVKWHFNPPSAPHAGGAWEVSVKAVKGLLLKQLGNTMLTYEEFATVLIQIEGCLNSRPLGVIHDSPEDRVILTPNHFLTGSSTFSHPEPEAENISLSSRWKYVQILKQQIFNEFKIQILQKQQPRRKWAHVQPNLKCNDVVVVQDHTCPSHKWPLGVIMETHPGEDGLVRVVSVKMENGRCFKRPINKIGLIPLLTNTPEEAISSNKGDKSTKSAIIDISRSDQVKESVKPLSSSIVEIEKNKQKHRSHKNKTSTVALWASMLCLFMLQAQAVLIPTTVNSFDHQSGLFFAKIGDMKATTSSWSIILYYNMTSFYTELNGLSDAAQLFAEKCIKHDTVTNYCYAIYRDIEQQLDEITQDNNILLDLNHVIEHPLKFKRKRRTMTSLLPFMGALSRAAFGTLDEQYAREMEYIISSMQADDAHLLNLIKNQTSVMETFLQQTRLSAERTTQQFEWVVSNLESIENAIQEVRTENTLLIRLQFIASHIVSRTQHLFSIQYAIIQAVTNAHHGNLRAILHPAVFKKQLTLMKTSLSPDITIPVTNNNLLKLYSLLSVETRVSENMIIFKFTLPLISTKHYELYKPIPLPFVYNGKLVILQPSTEYLAISLHRDKYIEISALELAECAHLDDTTSLCAEHHPEFKNNQNVNSCEMKIFAHQQFDQRICKSVMVTTDQLWIQLPASNRWVYYTKQPESYNVICDRDVKIIRLHGEGLLTLNSKCALEHKSFTIPRADTIETEILENLYFPELNISVPDEERITTISTNKSSIMLRRSDNLMDLEHKLTAIRVQQNLKTTSYTQHLPIGSFSIVVIFVIIVGCYQIWKCIKAKRNKIIEDNNNIEMKAVRRGQQNHEDDVYQAPPVPRPRSSVTQLPLF